MQSGIVCLVYSPSASESTAISRRKVATVDMDDHLLKPEDFEQLGNLSTDAAKIIMKLCMVLGSCAMSCHGLSVAVREKSPNGRGHVVRYCTG